MLCKDLGCGHALTNTHHNMEGTVSILAMYPSKHTTNLTDSVIMKKDKDTVCDDIPTVVCSGNDNVKKYTSYN